MHVFWPLFYLFLCHSDHWTWAVLEMADNLLLCMGKAFSPRSWECVYLLTLRQGHSLARDRERKGRERAGERTNGGRAVEEWKAKASAMQIAALQPWIIQSVEWKSCFSDPSSLTSAGVGHSHLGSFGLRTSHSVQRPPPPPPLTIRSHPLLQYFCSCPLYLFVFRNHFLPLLIHRNSARLLPSRFPLRSSSLISLAASFLPNCLKRIARRRKEAPLCFMALISLYSWSVDYTLPAAMGDTDGEPLWGPLSKLFLLKERRERIISHLLNIRFIHNAPGVFIEWELLLLLIAAMVAAVELVSCAPSFVSPSHPSLEPHFWNWCYNALRLPLSPPRWKILFLCFAFVYFFAFNVLLSLSVCCFIPHWAERELNILFDGLEPERFWIIHSRLLMCLSATGVSYAPDSGFLLVTESPQTLQSHS